MKKLLFLLTISCLTATAQTIQKIDFNNDYKDIKVDKNTVLKYELHFKNKYIYKIKVQQQGIDVVLNLTDKKGNKIIEMDSPNGINGLEVIDYTADETNVYYLTINRLEEEGNTFEGLISIHINEPTKTELKEIEKIRKELEPENKKIVSTVDIDHFWQAFDNLKTCKNRNDSIASFQKIYLDRATNGLKDFMERRKFTAEKFVNVVHEKSKFYNSIRQNTLETKNSVAVIEEIISKFKEIYPSFKEKKICFAIGFLQTGGTVSKDYLLIGSEITTATKFNDLTEFNNSALSKTFLVDGTVLQKIKNMISHEYVHTQQPNNENRESIKCDLLYAIMTEGFCDFIGEKLSGGQINKAAQEYGDAHEKELWIEFKNEMCNEKTTNWLYNFKSVKDKPADLGYYIGYKIAKEYYENATDKKQAIIDIIEMNDPILFLQKSKYDQKINKL